MKYVLLFCGDADDAAAFAALTPDELRARYAEVGAWFAEHRARIGGSNQLQGPETATSVRFGAGRPAGGDRRPVSGGQGGHRRLRRGRCGRPGRSAADGEDMAGTRDRGDPPRHDQGLTPAPDDRIAAAQDSLAAAFREESQPADRLGHAHPGRRLRRRGGGRPGCAAGRMAAVARRRSARPAGRLASHGRPPPCDRRPPPRPPLPGPARGNRFPRRPRCQPGRRRGETTASCSSSPAATRRCATEAQVALTLRTVCGLTTAEIARAFLVSEAAIIQRLTRPAARSPRPASPTGSRTTTSSPSACPACSPSSTCCSTRAT